MGENKYKSAQSNEPEIQEISAQTLKSEETSSSKSSKKAKGKKGKGGNTVMTILGGNFLIKEKFTKQFPFMVYITILLMAIINNTYIAEEYNREIATTTKKLNDLQVEYIQLKSSIMEASKQSVLSKKLRPIGIKEPVEPLRRINIENEPESTTSDEN